MRKSLRRNDGGNIVHVTSCQLTIDSEKHRKWDSNKKRRLHYLDRSKAGQWKAAVLMQPTLRSVPASDRNTLYSLEREIQVTTIRVR